MKSKDTMGRLEKVAITSAVSGAVFNVFLYGVGATLADAKGAENPLLYIRIVAALLQAAAFDLVAISTVMGMRDGRRGRWSWATAIASAVVSALIALDVAGVWSQPWLHAANSLIILAFTFHLMTPRKVYEARAAQLRRLVRRLTAVLRRERQTYATYVAASEQTVTALRQSVAGLEQALTEARQELASRPPPRTEEVIIVASFRLSWAQLMTLIDVAVRNGGLSQSTVRRQVADIGERLTLELTEE